MRSPWFRDTEGNVPPLKGTSGTDLEPVSRIRGLTHIIIPRLTSVVEVTLELECDDYFPGPHAKSSTFAPFISALWSCFSPYLERLRISTTTKGLQNILPPALSHNFPALKALDISLISDNNNPRATIANVYLPRSVILNIVSPFFRSLSPTLESLTLTISADFTALCGVLGQFPRLRKLDIHLVTLKMTLNERLHFISFLSNYQHFLTHFKFRVFALDHPHSVELYKEICALNFASLETFELGNFWQYLPRIKDMNFPSIPTLRTFIMDGTIVLDRNVIDLVRVLGHACPQLRRLHLRIRNLDTLIFDCLDSELPQLKELDLTFSLCAIDFHRHHPDRKGISSCYVSELALLKIPSVTF